MSRLCTHVVSEDFDSSGAGAVSVLGALPRAECAPVGRSALGSVIYLSDERLNQPQQIWKCLLRSMRFSKAN